MTPAARRTENPQRSFHFCAAHNLKDGSILVDDAFDPELEWMLTSSFNQLVSKYVFREGNSFSASLSGLFGCPRSGTLTCGPISDQVKQIWSIFDVSSRPKPNLVLLRLHGKTKLFFALKVVFRVFTSTK